MDSPAVPASAVDRRNTGNGTKDTKRRLYPGRAGRCGSQPGGRRTVGACAVSLDGPQRRASASAAAGKPAVSAGREPAAQRLSAARQYVAEALAEEAVTVTDIALAPAEQDRTRLTVQLEYQGTDLSVSLVI